MSKGGFYVSLCLLRLALPLTLIGCILVRQTALSVVYLLLYFALPYVPLANGKTMKGSTGYFLQTSVILSLLNVLAQFSFQMFLVFQQPYGDFLRPCNFTEKLLRHIGFIRLDGVDSLSGVMMMLPDALMLVCTMAILLVVQRTTREDSPGAGEPSANDARAAPNLSQFAFLSSKSKYLALLLLLLTGALRPSVPNAVYYLVFLGGATWWACFKDLGKTFTVICRGISVFAALHISVLLSYQTQYFQDVLDPNATYARYFGLTALRTTVCSDPRTMNFSDEEWASYINPLVILILYYVLALQGPAPSSPKGPQDVGEKGLSRTFSQRLSQRRLVRNPTMRWKAGNRKVRGSISSASLAQSDVFAEDSPLISSVGHASRYRATSIGSGLKSDPHGSVIVADTDADNIQLNQINPRDESFDTPNCLELTIDAIISIFQLLIRSSYIATNIIMMAWSIKYHSWLTFVLLLWASVLWMIPNQRTSMLRCSPYIVIYAEFLLLAQYIFGMNLNNDELPEFVNGVKLSQIGFEKPKELPFEPIMAKTSFTVMFWITMRQFCQERWERKQTSALSDMAAPLRVSVSTASAAPHQEESSAWIKNFGFFVKKLMTKFWIWVVAISLFIIGITGTRITVFRIVYMGLFLIFILTFQISYRVWRQMMYGFWLTVIVYSMSILVLVYTYQFDNFKEYWATYLHIDEKLQLDIGLEKFDTAELFIRLLAPTFFVVITVVQLHYFHKDFLAISDLRNRGASVSRSGKGSSRSDGSSMQPEESVPPPSELAPDDIPLLGPERVSFRNLRQLSSTEIKLLLNWVKQILLNIIELVILFLELHMLKIVLLSIMLLCCYNVTATHLILVVLCVVASLMGSKVQTTVVHICSIVIALLFLLTMIYQIQYINEDVYIVNCTEIIIDPATNKSYFANNPEWLGFKKATNDVPLVYLLQGYIGVFAVITSHAVINTRQRIHRQETGRPKPYTLFPGVTRELSDLNIRNCLKYLVNYGFYKFGVEICLMACVGVIGSRMDFYALIYAVWLAALFSLPRTTLARIWNSLTIFIAVMISLQYILVIGVPPGLCIYYPWYSSEVLRRLQKWMFLPDPIDQPSAYKIVCDFILLLLVCRQSLCFRIERRHRNISYAGGSNDVIIQDYNQTDFHNPYLDHMTYTKSWLDLVKKGVFSALLWVTLAVTFTAGTSRVNIFSIGYLIGSFIFLWQGNDLYLRPVQNILRWWNWLLGYNVMVILIKALLQIGGCIFLDTLQGPDTCWVVQLLGIGCVSKFGDQPKTPVGDVSQCVVPDADIGLAWDGVCFGFLIMQRRFFNSYYFFHHIDEAKAMTILQSRGAELIEELRQQQLQAQQTQERKVLEKIRHKMDRIKASQQKVLNPPYKGEASSHYTGSSEGLDAIMEDISERLATKHKSRQRAIRSGDYYMFDDIDDEELDLIKEDEDESSSEMDDMDGKRRFTMSKFLSTALKTDINKAANQALTTEDVAPQPRPIRSRRASMPASVFRRKSSITRRPAPSSVLSAPTPGSSIRLSPHARSDIGVRRRSPISSLVGSPRPEVRIGGSQPPGDDRGDDTISEGDMKEAVHEPVKEKITQKLWQSFKVLWAFVESVMVSMIRTLNKISKDYRYVVRVLAQEKRELKESPHFIEGNRTGTSKVWKPKPEVIIHLGEIMTATSPRGSVGSGSPDESTVPLESPITKEEKEKLNRPALSTITESEDQDMHSAIENSFDEREQLMRADSLLPDIRIIAPSQERGLDDDYFLYEESGSETDTDKEEWSAASSPIYLQLMLATWYAIISHSELVCYFMIFLHQLKSPTILSLPLPLMVFLWGSLTMPRPTKTFWITLIAYTEVVVVIKCLFQFEILPWNQTISPERNPFYPPTIIGIEKKSSYASSDLLLLLIIFFHRYMLKSLGLWKSSYEDVASSILENGQSYHEFSPHDETKSLTSKENKGYLQEGSEKENKSEMQLAISSTKTSTDGKESDDEKSDTSSTTKESGSQRTVIKKSRLRKTFICVTGEDSDRTEDGKVVYTRESQETFEKFPHYFQKAGAQYCSSTKDFFSQLLDTGWRLSADVYAYMFICDFFNFLVVLFGFYAFGTQQGDGGVSSYLEENKVPIPFLLMMILQFALIVIDRALYLRKYILGKIIFQFLLVVGVHLWMFFVLPAITERPFNQLLPPQMWYMVKCFYLLMSAYQIRAGYPTRILGNFLCKKYNYINMYSFRGFMAVPFLFELRALMDWIWTDTSMTLSDWLKMEDIFAQIFQLKCQRRAEVEYPLPRGERKRPISKYLLGGAGLFLIIAIIWFPLVLFALGNTVGESNVPYDVTISLRIGAYQYIYEMSAQNNTILKYHEDEFDILTNAYKRNKDRDALTFLSNYQFDDVAVVKLSGNSTMTWGISPPDQTLLLDEIESNKTISVKFSWRVSRVSNNPEMVGIVVNDHQVTIEPFVNGVRNQKRIDLANMLRGKNQSQSIEIENILPKFLKITNKGDADPISKLMGSDRGNPNDINATYRNISISLKTGNSSIGVVQQWWEVKENCDDDKYKNFLKSLPQNDCGLYISIFTFNDKAFPATLSFISGKGIIGLYVSIVFVMWTLVRGFFTGISSKIMFDDMPNVDRILQLCLDIYLVRESNEFALEEDLFAKLVFLYRSPETIIKWTREREDLDDDEDIGDGSQLPSIAN